MNNVFELAKEQMKSKNAETIKRAIVTLEQLADTELDQEELFRFIAYGYRRLGNEREFYEALAQISDDNTKRELLKVSPLQINSTPYGRIFASSVLIFVATAIFGRNGSVF